MSKGEMPSFVARLTSAPWLSSRAHAEAWPLREATNKGKSSSIYFVWATHLCCYIQDHFRTQLYHKQCHPSPRARERDIKVTVKVTPTIPSLLHSTGGPCRPAPCHSLTLFKFLLFVIFSLHTTTTSSSSSKLNNCSHTRGAQPFVTSQAFSIEDGVISTLAERVRGGEGGREGGVEVPSR
jgi:hypothetical protein